MTSPASNWAAKTGGVFYALWGIVHILGAAMQLSILGSEGPASLTAMIATGAPFDPSTNPVPAEAGMVMGMGAFNLLWIGVLVTVVAVTLNWRNRPLGYWLNLGVVGMTDVGLLLFLLLPGTMSWRDGGIGISLFFLALVFATLGLRWSPAPIHGSASASP